MLGGLDNGSVLLTGVDGWTTQHRRNTLRVLRVCSLCTCLYRPSGFYTLMIYFSQSSDVSSLLKKTIQARSPEKRKGDRPTLCRSRGPVGRGAPSVMCLVPLYREEPWLEFARGACHRFSCAHFLDKWLYEVALLTWKKNPKRRVSTIEDTGSTFPPFFFLNDGAP